MAIMNILTKKTSASALLSSLLFVSIFMFGTHISYAQDDGYYGDGSVSDGTYGGGSVSDGYYGGGNVSDGYYGGGTVSDGYLGDGSVSDGYYGNGSVSDGYYGGGTVSDGYLGDGSVTDGYLGNGSITDGYLGSGTITDGYLGSCGSNCGTTDAYGNTTTDVGGVGYSEENYATGETTGSTGSSGGSYSTGSSGYGGYGGQTTFSAPGYSYSAPISYSAPVQAQQYISPRPVEQQQQQQQIVQAQPNVTTTTTTNTCTGNSCNYTNSSINGSYNSTVSTAPVIPVYQAPVTYPVQYVYPQQPSYPVYPTYYNNNYNNVYCTITASPSSVENGQPAYLTWSAPNATSAWLSDGIGSVAVNGSLAVRPNLSETYTLTVSGYGGTNTCTTYVTVAGAYPYVSLSQIPYTGFDFGTMGDAIYWLSLLSFAVAGAYLLVYYRGGMLALAGNAAGRSASSAASAPVKIVQAAAKRIDTVMAPVFSKASPETANATSDAMIVAHSKNGEAPRIVITRS
jgi:hypothetical protein